MTNEFLLLGLLYGRLNEPESAAAPASPASAEPAPTPPEQADRAPSEDVPDEVPAPEGTATVETVATASAPTPAPSPAAKITGVAPSEAPAKAHDPNKDPTDVETTRYVPGKGFELATKDGRFSMQLRARVQIRYDLDHPNREGETTEQTMQIRRARLQLQGNLFGKHNRYYIQLGFSPRDQTGGLIAEDGSIRRNPLRDARVEFDYLRDFTIWAGQMKIPFSRQRVISSGNLNLVDRSLPNEEFQLDRDIGVQALSKDVGGMGWLAYNVGVFMGEGRNAFEPSNLGMLYVARVEFLPFGKFDDYTEGDLERMKKPGLSIGGAYAFHDRAPGDRSIHGSVPEDGGTTDIHSVTADVMFKWHGVSLHSNFHWRKGVHRENGGLLDEEGNAIPTALPRNGLGWFGQLGWLVPKIPFEVVARYGFARKRGGNDSALPWRDELGGGVNYYFAGHNLKLQLDYFRLWGADTGADVVAAMKHGTDRIRLQLQMAF